MHFFQKIGLLFLVTLSAYATTGPYLQLQGGIGGMYTKDYDTNGCPYDQVSLRSGSAYRVSAGYLLNHNTFHYGVELGYAGYPQNQYSFSIPSLQASGMQVYKGHAVDLLGALKLNLKEFHDQAIYIQGKAGAAYVTQIYNGESAALGTVFALNSTVSQLKPELAASIGYQFNKTFDVNLSYHYLFAGQADPFASSTVYHDGVAQVSSVGLFVAGIACHFG